MVAVIAANLSAQPAPARPKFRWGAFAGIGALSQSVGPVVGADVGIEASRILALGAELMGTASGGRHLEAALVSITLSSERGFAGWIRPGVGIVNRPIECVQVTGAPYRAQCASIVTGGLSVGAGFDVKLGAKWRLGPSLSYLGTFADGNGLANGRSISIGVIGIRFGKQ